METFELVVSDRVLVYSGQGLMKRKDSLGETDRFAGDVGSHLAEGEHGHVLVAVEPWHHHLFIIGPRHSSEVVIPDKPIHHHHHHHHQTGSKSINQSSINQASIKHRPLKIHSNHLSQSLIVDSWLTCFCLSSAGSALQKQATMEANVKRNRAPTCQLVTEEVPTPRISIRQS